MSTTDILLRPRLKKSGNSLKASWYCVGGGYDLNTTEILSEINNGTNIDFDFDYKGAYQDRFQPNKLLINLFRQLERIVGGSDINLMNRIILNGGFVSYIEKLENEVIQKGV